MHPWLGLPPATLHLHASRPTRRRTARVTCRFAMSQGTAPKHYERRWPRDKRTRPISGRCRDRGLLRLGFGLPGRTARRVIQGERAHTWRETLNAAAGSPRPHARTRHWPQQTRWRSWTAPNVPAIFEAHFGVRLPGRAAERAEHPPRRDTSLSSSSMARPRRCSRGRIDAGHRRALAHLHKKTLVIEIADPLGPRR